MTDLLEVYFVLIVVLLVFSAVFSGSETALTAANRSRIHGLGLAGDRRAARATELMEDREHLISAILIGNNLFNIAVASMATYVFTELVGEAGVVYAIAAMTVLVVIFAEIMPKTYAIRNAEFVALAVAPFMRGVVWLAQPLTWALQGLVQIMFRLAGARDSRDETIPSDEELRSILDLYRHEGGLVKDQHAMLDGVLDLSDVVIGEVMTHRRSMETINADEPLENIIEAALASSHTRIPLWRDDPDNIVGILHAKSLARALYRHRDRGVFDITEVATEPWFAPDTTSLSEQLAVFRERHLHFAVVVDQYGGIMGVVTLEDILEEIVGDIEDEHDVREVETKIGEDGTLMLSGAATIRDLNREFDWNLPEDGAITIAGLVIQEAQQIPDAGQVFEFHNFRFEVLERQRNQIVQLRVTPPSGETGEG